jgi:hypothetical protein
VRVSTALGSVPTCWTVLSLTPSLAVLVELEVSVETKPSTKVLVTAPGYRHNRFPQSEGASVILQTNENSHFGWSFPLS